jgi:hypothetical protein
MLQVKVQIILADRWSKTTPKVVLLLAVSGIMSPKKVNKERKKTKEIKGRQRQMYDRKLGDLHTRND